MFCILTSKSPLLYVCEPNFLKLPRSLQHILYRQAARYRYFCGYHRFGFAHSRWQRLAWFLIRYFPQIHDVRMCVKGGGIYA